MSHLALSGFHAMHVLADEDGGEGGGGFLLVLPLLGVIGLLFFWTLGRLRSSRPIDQVEREEPELTSSEKDHASDADPLA